MSELPLGKAVAYDSAYDPTLLYPLPRAEGRARLGIAEPVPFFGCDIWNGYELSWLNAAGKPVVAWGEFRFPADSPAIVESKSFKLYLNGLNQHGLDNVEQAQALLARDLSAAVGAPVEVALRLPAQWAAVPFHTPAGFCLDELDLAIDHYEPAPELLRCSSATVVERSCYSRLLRSRCPVTGQPDWGAVQIDYAGPEIDPAGLLAYIVSFRQHQDFHEQCVERMFVDILERCRPTRLTVYARYLRRGGLDINPFRSSVPVRPDNPRWFQQ